MTKTNLSSHLATSPGGPAAGPKSVLVKLWFGATLWELSALVNYWLDYLGPVAGWDFQNSSSVLGLLLAPCFFYGVSLGYRVAQPVGAELPTECIQAPQLLGCWPEPR